MNALLLLALCWLAPSSLACKCVASSDLEQFCGAQFGTPRLGLFCIWYDYDCLIVMKATVRTKESVNNTVQDSVWRSVRYNVDIDKELKAHLSSSHVGKLVRGAVVVCRRRRGTTKPGRPGRRERAHSGVWDPVLPAEWSWRPAPSIFSRVRRAGKTSDREREESE